MNGEVFYPQVTQRISGNTAGATALISSGTMVLSGGNNITLSQNGQTIEVQGGAGGAGGSFSAGVSTIGNTLGNTGTVSNQLVFAGGNNITLSQSTNAGGATVTVQGAAGGAGGAALKGSGTYTQNTGTVEFANSNGITFGLSNNGTMTASHNGLTTARASNDAIGLNTAQTNVTWTVNSSGLSLNAGGYAGTATATTGNISITLNTAGLSLNAPAFLTTAAQSSASNISGVIAATASGAATNQTAQLSGAISFSNTNGISFFTTASGAVSGIGATVKTDYQTAGAYLTTARASNDAVGLNTAQTNVTWTVNSSGISLNAGAYLTTAMASNAATISNINFSAGTTSLNLSKLTFADSNGISFGLSGNSVVTGTVKTDYQSSNANYLTSQSNQALSGSNGSFTFQTATFGSSNGMHFYSTNGSLVGSYTVPTVTDYFSKTNTTFNGTNVSGSLTLNTNGLRVDLSAGAGGGAAISGGANSQNTGTVNFANSNGVSFGLSNNGTMTASFSAPAVSNSAGSFTWQTLNFSNANNVTWGTSAGSIVTASVAAPGAAAENNNHNLLGANTAGNTTASGSTIGLSGINLTLSGTNGSAINISAPATSSLSATGQVSISTNGSTISIGVPAALTVSRYNEFKESPLVAGQQGQGRLHLQPWIIPNLHMDRVIIHVNLSNASNSSGSGSFSNWIGLYTKNVSTLSLLASTSASTAVTMSGTVGSYSLYGGFRQHSIGWTNTLTAGMYWIGVINSSTTGGANMSYSQMLNSQINTNFSGQFGVASNATNALSLGFGVYTAATAGLPATINFNQINGTASLALRPPSVFFVSGSQ